MPRPFSDVLHSDALTSHGNRAGALCRSWYEHSGRPLYSYLRFYLASADLADDLTAEGFLRALRHSGSFDPALGTLTPAHTVRLEGSGGPVLEQLQPGGLTRIRHCCQDFDGGGPPDDELVVIATPPDRVHTAAIYELR